jgi:hypothetical protein
MIAVGRSAHGSADIENTSLTAALGSYSKATNINHLDAHHCNEEIYPHYQLELSLRTACMDALLTTLHVLTYTRCARPRIAKTYLTWVRALTPPTARKSLHCRHQPL